MRDIMMMEHYMHMRTTFDLHTSFNKGEIAQQLNHAKYDSSLPNSLV